MGALGEDGHVMQSPVSGFEPPAGLLAVGAALTALPVVAAARSQARAHCRGVVRRRPAVVGGPRPRGPKAFGSVKASVVDRALPGVPVVQPEHAT